MAARSSRTFIVHGCRTSASAKAAVQVSVRFGARAPRKWRAQEQDVGAPAAERRHLDGVLGQARVEVAAEAPRLTLGAQVDVGGRDQAHVDAAKGRRAERGELPRLQDAQQLGLELERHDADLVEEEAAAVGRGEGARRIGRGVSEGTLLVAEQRGLHEVGGDGPAIHGDQRPGPPAQAMDPAAMSSLPTTGLADDEHRGGRRGHPIDDREGGGQRRRAADDLGVLDGRGDLHVDDELEHGLAHADDRPLVEGAGPHPRAVDEGAVGASVILDLVAVLAGAANGGMTARDPGVVERQVDVLPFLPAEGQAIAEGNPALAQSGILDYGAPPGRGPRGDRRLRRPRTPRCGAGSATRSDRPPSTGAASSGSPVTSP
jgi:hypothetical protein